jgi:hypothetical protein
LKFAFFATLPPAATPRLQHASARMQTVAPLLTGGTVVASMCILGGAPVDEKKTCRVFTA